MVKNYTSGMVQTWNKFCFTGGVLEISLQLPGPMNGGGKRIYLLPCPALLLKIPENVGLWPAAWLLGNLARATFEKSTMVSLTIATYIASEQHMNFIFSQ